VRITSCATSWPEAKEQKNKQQAKRINRRSRPQEMELNCNTAAGHELLVQQKKTGRPASVVGQD
jgi:hypothetical protein